MNEMDLNTICFGMFGFLFLGYLLLEGFDYGAGMLLPFLGDSAEEKDAILQTTAPVWEGNEVWLIAAASILFTGFPHVYATLFSGLYLALLILLVTLILRGAAFEFRDKDSSIYWRKFWDWSVFAGSMAPSLLWGIAVTSLLAGLPIDAQKQFTGTFWDLVNFYTLAGGLVFANLFLLHGAVYLTLRLDRRLVPRFEKFGLAAGRYALLLSAGFIVLSLLYTDSAAKPVFVFALTVPFLAVFFCLRSLKKRQYRLSFLFSSAAVVSTVFAVLLGLFPRFVVSSQNPDWSLTIYNSASNPLTLKIITLTISAVLPALLLFEAWKYYIFRDRITASKSDHNPEKMLWAELRGQLGNLRNHSTRLLAIITKRKRAMKKLMIKTDKERQSSVILHLNELRRKIRYSQKVAATITKLLSILRK